MNSRSQSLATSFSKKARWSAEYRRGLTLIARRPVSSLIFIGWTSAGPDLPSRIRKSPCSGSQANGGDLRLSLSSRCRVLSRSCPRVHDRDPDLNHPLGRCTHRRFRVHRPRSPRGCGTQSWTPDAAVLVFHEWRKRCQHRGHFRGLGGRKGPEHPPQHQSVPCSAHQNLVVHPKRG